MSGADQLGTEGEVETVALAQADPARFADLYRGHVHAVHALAWSRLGDRSAAEDATAETFRRALRGLPRYEVRGVPIGAWLTRICVNVINDERARRARAGTVTAPLPAELSDTEACAAFDHVSTRALVQSLVARLPPDQRLVLQLRFGDDLPIAEVAANLGRSPDAVKQLQRRALIRLRKLAAEEGVDG